ncbi:hypothetical protein ABVT39_006245 [Epinephelus coioides]
MPSEEDLLLRKANKTITDLKEDIRRLSDELKNKESLLASCLDMAHEQSLRIVSLTTALQDTAPWDPSTCPRPSSCSTPHHQSSWAEVAVRGRKTAVEGTASPPRLSLSNRFAVLSGDDPALSRRDLDPSPSTASSPPAAGDVWPVALCSTKGPHRQLSSQATTSASWRKILKEAVLRRSAGPHCPKPGDNNTRLLRLLSR